MGGIGIITNPHSKQNKRQPTRGKVLGYILGQFGNLEVTQSLDDLTRVAQSFRKQSIDILAINGGDGTISRTLTAFIREYKGQKLPKVLVLRGGTMNVLADNLGIRGTPEQILMRMLESVSGVRVAEEVPLATLSVGGQYGFLFGNGFIATYLKEFYRNKAGGLAAVTLILKIYLWWIFARSKFLAFIPTRTYRLLVNGSEHEGPVQSTAMMASTVEKMPLGPRLFPAARQSLSRFQYFSLESSPLTLPWKLPISLLRNGEGTFYGKKSRLVASLLIADESGRQEYTLDGELFLAPGGRLSVELGPVIQFIVV